MQFHKHPSPNYNKLLASLKIVFCIQYFLIVFKYKTILIPQNRCLSNTLLLISIAFAVR